MIKLRRGLLIKGTPYHFALSMGVDSLSAFSYLRAKGYDVRPLHFNHGLRAENDLMEAKYLELCGVLRFTPVVGRGSGLSSESDCREARLSFYRGVGVRGLITAHHLNDWVENYLMNCFRGLPNRSPMNWLEEFDGFSVFHPFLLSRKVDLVEFASRNSIGGSRIINWVVPDSSNDCVVGCRRNWVRNVVLPELRSRDVVLEKFAKRRLRVKI